MALLIPTLLTQGIYTGIVSTISAVTIKSCYLIKTVYLHQHPNISRTIREIDIERRLQLIQSVINLIDDNSRNDEATIKLDDMEKTQIFDIIGSRVQLQSDPIELCLQFLHEIIQDIHNDLFAINRKVSHHNKKWFATWRTLNILPLIENLRINSVLLENRFNDLTKISIFLSKR